MTKESLLPLRQMTACLGIAAVGLLIAVLGVFSWLNPEFGWIEDYISKLGAKGQPFALWWNLVGFALVGMLFAAFGWAYGRVVEDRLVGVLFTSFGVGYAVTGDMNQRGRESNTFELTPVPFISAKLIL